MYQIRYKNIDRISKWFRVTVVAIAMAVPLSVDSATAWPFFKNDQARSSVATATSLPATLVPLWHYTQLGEPGDLTYAAPVTDGINSYATSSSGWVYAFNNSPTSVDAPHLWKFKTEAPVYASPAYAMVNGEALLYVASTDGNLYCLDINAATDATRLQWKIPLGNSSFSSPMVFSLGGVPHVLVVTTAGGVKAINHFGRALDIVG